MGRSLEQKLEQQLVGRLKQLGVVTLKLNLQGHRGWPDRLVLLPGGEPLFLELKRPGGTVEPLQEHRHQQLQQLGYRVRVVDNVDHAVRTVLRFLHLQAQEDSRG